MNPLNDNRNLNKRENLKNNFKSFRTYAVELRINNIKPSMPETLNYAQHQMRLVLYFKCNPKFHNLGVESMTHHNEEKKEEPKEEEAKVEPIHPSEQRGGKKKGLLDTCK